MGLFGALRGRKADTDGSLTDVDDLDLPSESSGEQKKTSLLGSIFKRAKSVDQAQPAKRGASMSSPVALLTDETGFNLVAFGLNWRTLVSSGGRDAAEQMARKAKATHLIFRSQILGYGTVPQKTEGVIYPASVLASKCHGGTAIFAIIIDDGRYWIAMVRNGQPTHTDVVLEVDTDAQAIRYVRDLASKFEGEPIAFFTDIRNSGLENIKYFSAQEIFDVVRSDQDQLQKLGKAGSTIPKPIMVAGIVGAVLLLGQKGWGEYSAYKRKQAMAADQVQEMTPEEAWAPVVKSFLDSTSLPSNLAIVTIRKSLSEMPVIWKGWVLQGVRCQASQVTNLKRNWGCQATYGRSRIGVTSSEIKVVAEKFKPGMTPVFPALNTMVLGWSVEQEVKVPAVADFGEPGALMLEISSVIQQTQPTLATIPEIKMAAYELPAPKRLDGTPYPRPTTVPELFRADVVLKGPMRSLDALSSRLEKVEWESIGLVFDAKANPKGKGLTGSALNMELAGKVYAKK